GRTCFFERPPMIAFLFLLSVAVLSACAISLAFTRNGEATARRRTHSEATAKPRRRRIQGARKVHPTALSVKDHERQWLTMSDNDDRVRGEKNSGAGARGACKRRPASQFS